MDYNQEVFTVCRLCNQTDQLKVVEKINNPVSTLYYCLKCDGQFWWPVQNPGEQWYEQTYAIRNQEPVQNLGWNHYQFLNEQLQPQTLLDVGCGIGHFLAAAQGKGWQVWGLDFDEEAVRLSNEFYKISTVERLSVEDYVKMYPERQFTAVTAFEVLEHMDDPQDFIKAVNRLLKHNGYVGISVPHRDSSPWLRPHDFPPRHLTRWNKISITNFLQNHGFKVIHCCLGAVTLERVLMRIKFSAGRLGSVNFINRVQKNNAVKTVISSNKVRWLRRIARFKDWVLFGIPALACWIYLWVTRRHYVSMYVLAQKQS